MLCKDRFQSDGIADDVDEVEPVETDSARKIARSNKIHLLNDTRFLRPDCRIYRLRSLGQLACSKFMSMDNPVDSPYTGQRINSQFTQFPLDRHSSTLCILLLQEALANRTDEILDASGYLARLMVRSPRAIPGPRRRTGRISGKPIVKPSARDLEPLANGDDSLAVKPPPNGIDARLDRIHDESPD
jgi:hypothetical protein